MVLAVQGEARTADAPPLATASHHEGCVVLLAFQTPAGAHKRPPFTFYTQKMRYNQAI